jgi:hypothetical protein
MPPADDFGGGASIAIRHAAPSHEDTVTRVGYAGNSGFSERAGEYGRTGVTAGSVPRIRQQAGMILVPRIALPCAISPQQEGRALDCIVSTHADAGIAVHKTTAASMSNATFLPQCIVGVSQFQLQVSMTGLEVGVSLITFRETWRSWAIRDASFPDELRNFAVRNPSALAITETTLRFFIQ